MGTLHPHAGHVLDAFPVAKTGDKEHNVWAGNPNPVHNDLEIFAEAIYSLIGLCARLFMLLVIICKAAYGDHIKVRLSPYTIRYLSSPCLHKLHDKLSISRGSESGLLHASTFVSPASLFSRKQM